MPGCARVLSVLVLGAVGTALAFVIFYKLINEVGAGRASLVSYLAPGRGAVLRRAAARRGDHRRGDRRPGADPRRRRARLAYRARAGIRSASPRLRAADAERRAERGRTSRWAGIESAGYDADDVAPGLSGTRPERAHRWRSGGGRRSSGPSPSGRAGPFVNRAARGPVDGGRTEAPCSRCSAGAAEAIYLPAAGRSAADANRSGPARSYPDQRARSRSGRRPRGSGRSTSCTWPGSGGPDRPVAREGLDRSDWRPASWPSAERRLRSARALNCFERAEGDDRGAAPATGVRRFEDQLDGREREPEGPGKVTAVGGRDAGEIGPPERGEGPEGERQQQQGDEPGRGGAWPARSRTASATSPTITGVPSRADAITAHASSSEASTSRGDSASSMSRRAHRGRRFYRDDQAGGRRAGDLARAGLRADTRT